VAPLSRDRGVALILALFLTAAASALAGSLMYLSQTETYATSNYRVMTQARYGAESGIHKAVNYLLNTYAAPGSVADPLATYNRAVSPVTYNGQPVILSANDSVASNYPVAAVRTAFANSAGGSLAAGHLTVAYKPYATLMSMRQLNDGSVALSWQITSVGRIAVGSATAEVEVSSMLERQVILTAFGPYAAFAAAPICGALKFSGGSKTDSYDSSTLALDGSGNPIPPAAFTSQGHVGTNGNLTESGGAIINGSLYTPRIGVGNCSNGNVNAETASGGATVTGGLVPLAQAVTPPVPQAPNPLPPTSSYNANGQTLLNGASVGNVTVNGGATITLGAPGVTSTITVNSIKLSGNSTLVVLGTVILNVAGTSQTSPIDLTGGTVTNASLDPSTFQIRYGGSGSVKASGGTKTAAVLNMPQASVSLSGGTSFYGAIIGNDITVSGGATIHYDKHLGTALTTTAAGPDMLSSFTWKKY
jgi:hypothetical protein